MPCYHGLVCSPVVGLNSVIWGKTVYRGIIIIFENER